MQRKEVLVHRIVVVHVELHHRDDAAEGADEFAEHAGFVHAPKHGFRLVLGGQNLQEQAVRLLVDAHVGVDRFERAGGGAHRLGMNREIVFLRQIEQPDQIHRVALEHVGAREREAVVLDNEVFGFGDCPPAARRAQSRDHAAEHRRRLGLPFLQAGAQNGGEIADMLGGEEVMLHEAFDVFQPRMLGVA